MKPSSWLLAQWWPVATLTPKSVLYSKPDMSDDSAGTEPTDTEKLLSSSATIANELEEISQMTSVVRAITDKPTKPPKPPKSTKTKTKPNELQNIATSPNFTYYNHGGRLYAHDEQRDAHHQLADGALEVLARWEHAHHPDDRRYEERTGVQLRIHGPSGSREYYLDSDGSQPGKELSIWFTNRELPPLLLPCHGPSSIRHIANIIAAATPETRLTVHTRNGWTADKTLYVAGSEVIPARPGHTGDFKDAPTLAPPRGTAEEWQTKIAEPLLATNHWGHQWAATVPLAALLIPIVPLPKTAAGGFHIHGRSSRGKSTALRVARSILGDDHSSGLDYMTWRATSNSLEVVARDYNHRMLPLDEIGQAVKESGNSTSGSVVESAYFLAQGVGKTRTNGNLENIAPIKFDTMCLSSGEHSFEAIVFAETRREVMAGQRVRFSDIDWSKKLAPHLTDDQMADLQDGLEDCSGTIGRAFIAEVAALTPEDRRALKKRFREIRDKISPPGTDGKHRRVGERFALCILAAELAKSWGLFPKAWKPFAAPIRVYEEWKDANGAIDEGLRACVSLHEYIAAARANGEFHSVCANEADHVVKARQVAGFLYDHAGSSEEGALDSSVGRTGVRLLPKAFAAAISGASPAIVKRYLSENKILHHKGDRYTCRMNTVKTSAANFENRILADSSTKVYSINLFCLTGLLEKNGLINKEDAPDGPDAAIETTGELHPDSKGGKVREKQSRLADTRHHASQDGFRA